MICHVRRACAMVALLLTSLILFGAPSLTAQNSTYRIHAADSPTYLTQVQIYLYQAGIPQGSIYGQAGGPEPDLNALLQSEVILVWSNRQFRDSSAFGNALADFVDAGGHVIVANYANSTVAPLQGRWESGGYFCQTRGNYSTGTRTALGSVAQPNHPIMNGIQNVDFGSDSV